MHSVAPTLLPPIGFRPLWRSVPKSRVGLVLAGGKLGYLLQRMGQRMGLGEVADLGPTALLRSILETTLRNRT